MIRYRMTVPGTALELSYTRAEDDGRLLDLRCGERVHAVWDGDALILGDGLARVSSRPEDDGFTRTVETAGHTWTERYVWDADGHIVHVDGVDVRRDGKGRVTACVDTDGDGTWRYGYAGRDLSVIDAPDGTRHLTPAEDGRPLWIRAGGERRRLDYDAEGTRPAAAPENWHHDEAGRLWTVLAEDGTVAATYLWDGAACLGRIDGPADRPLSTVYSLDPGGTPVRIIGPDGVVRVPRDAFGEGLLAHEGTPGLFGGAVHRGLVHLPARVLDPAAGAFCAGDPYDGGAGDPRRKEGYTGDLPVETATGRYAVCRHDPVGRTDPSGAISWWLPLSDFTWGLQNNVVSMFGLDFTVNWWASLLACKPGRWFDFAGANTSDRIGAYALRRDGIVAGSRSFTFAHNWFVNEEGVERVTKSELFEPTAAFAPTYYGSVLRLARSAATGPPPMLLAGDANLAPGPLAWNRGGGVATPAIPGAAASVFLSGGVFFSQPDDTPWRAHTDAALTELFPAGTVAAGAFAGGVVEAPITGADGLAAARAEQYGFADLDALRKAMPVVSFGLGTLDEADRTVSFNGATPNSPRPGAVGPGQVVFVAGTPEVVTRVTVTCEFDRAITDLTGTLTLSQVAATGNIYDATVLPDSTVAVAPTVSGGANRTQFPRFTAGELVAVAWNHADPAQAGPDEFAIESVDGGHLTLTGGRAPIPVDATAVTVTRLVPIAATAGTVAQGRNGRHLAGEFAEIDLWSGDQADAWAATGTTLALSDAVNSRPVRMKPPPPPTTPPTTPPAPDWRLTFGAVPSAANPVTVAVPPPPTSTGYYATVSTDDTTTRLADPSGGTEPTGANLVIVTGFAPGETPAATGRSESGHSRTAEADEDFETDKYQGLADHELMHTVQSQRLGPWLLACFPLALFELGRIAPALRDFDMPDYSAFGEATISVVESKRILTVDNAAGVSYGKGDDVQIWTTGRPTIATLGEAFGGGFTVIVRDVPDGPVGIRKVNVSAGLTTYRVFYEVISAMTHTGMMSLVSGTIWGGLFYLIGRGGEMLHLLRTTTKCDADVNPSDSTILVLKPGGDDKEKAEKLAKFRNIKRVLLKKGEDSVLREVATADPPTLVLAAPVNMSGRITVSTDTTHGSIWDDVDYFPASVPDPARPGTVKVEPSGDKTLTLHIHDRVIVEFADAVGSKDSNSVRTCVSHVRENGLVELQDPPFVKDQSVAVGRIAKLAASDGAGWADSWLLERMGMDWMKWIYDPYGQLTLRTNPKHNSAEEIVARVFRYLIGGKSWSFVPPVFGYYWWDNLFNQPANGYRSLMEQEASQESGRLYSAEGRLRVEPMVVGDIGRYWFFISSNGNPWVRGSQDSPGVTAPQVPTVMPLVTAETGTTSPPFNKGATVPALTPVAGAPPNPGGCVPDVFYAKTAVTGEPTGPARSFQFTDQGAIPLLPATAYNAGVHVAFCRPGKHRITLADGFSGSGDPDTEFKARDAQDREIQRVYFDRQIDDVSVVLGGFPVTEGATVRLLAGQRAGMTVTPGGPGRKHALTVVRPADGPIRTADDGDTLIAAAATPSAPAEISRRYRPGEGGLHTDGGLAGRRVHLDRDVHIPVRVFSVEVSTTLVLRTSTVIDPAAPESNKVTTLHPGTPVFLILPVTPAGAPTVSPADAVTMTVAPVPEFPEALRPFVGDGVVFRLTFDAPAAATAFTIGVMASIPGSPGEPPVALVTEGLTLEKS